MYATTLGTERPFLYVAALASGIHKLRNRMIVANETQNLTKFPAH